MTRATRRLRDKVQLWLRPPEWRPADLAGPGESAAEPPRASGGPDGAAARPEPRRVAAVDAYIAVQLVLVLGAALLSMIYSARVTAAGSVLLAIEILAALAGWGALIEGRRWGWWLEWARLGSLAALAVVWGLATGPLAAAAPLAAVAGLAAWSARVAARQAASPTLAASG